MPEFREWPKIPRYKNNMVTITEKMDGTNACIIIEDGQIVGCQSRSRIITPEDDNYGFAGWVEKNKEELLKLGEGYHYGEWVGKGIQKNPHNFDDKYFFLFNVGRWNEETKPACCDVVPVLFEGPFEYAAPEKILLRLKFEYRLLEPAEPEGIVIYFHDTRSYAKLTIKNTEGKHNNDAERE